MRPHAVVTAQGPRPSLEDRAWTDGATRLIVCDGMGGHADGDRAAQAALDCARELSLSDTREQVVERVRSEVGRDGGTTLSVVELRADTLRWLHAGDSALWLVMRLADGDATIQRLTADHSRWGGLVAAGHAPDTLSLRLKSVLDSCVMAPSFRTGAGAVTWDEGAIALPDAGRVDRVWLFGTTDGFHEAFEGEAGVVDTTRLLAGLRDLVQMSEAEAQVYADGCASETHDNATVAWWRIR